MYPRINDRPDGIITFVHRVESTIARKAKETWITLWFMELHSAAVVFLHARCITHIYPEVLPVAQVPVLCLDSWLCYP